MVSGTITFKFEYLAGIQWFTMVLALKVFGKWDFNKTLPLFPIPFVSSENSGLGPVNASSVTAGADFNKQWLEQLHLFSKLALETGGALPEVAAVSS